MGFKNDGSGTSSLTISEALAKDFSLSLGETYLEYWSVPYAAGAVGTLRQLVNTGASRFRNFAILGDSQETIPEGSGTENDCEACSIRLAGDWQITENAALANITINRTKIEVNSDFVTVNDSVVVGGKRFVQHSTQA